MLFSQNISIIYKCIGCNSFVQVVLVFILSFLSFFFLWKGEMCVKVPLDMNPKPRSFIRKIDVSTQRGKRASFKTLKVASKWKCHPVDSSNSLNLFVWHLVELQVNGLLWSYLKNCMSKLWSSLFIFTLTFCLAK